MLLLVNENDEYVGVAEKYYAHKEALLHRAFSVFIFNSKNELLLQQRSMNKYHTPGLWTNTCCSHPHPNEDVKISAQNRLVEEMGIYSRLKFVTKILYKYSFDNGLYEHELDHIFVGYSDQKPEISHNEVHTYKYMNIESVISDIKANPYIYTPWFKAIIGQPFWASLPLYLFFFLFEFQI